MDDEKGEDDEPSESWKRLEKIHRQHFITKAEVRSVCGWRERGTHDKKLQPIPKKFAISLDACLELRDHRLERQSASVPGPGDDGPEYPGRHGPMFQSLFPMEEPGACLG